MRQGPGALLTAVLLVLASAATAADLSQIHTRWRNDDGSEGAATWAAAEDTPLTGLARETPRRLRFEVSNEDASSSSPLGYELQTARTATCAAGVYTTVPTDGSGEWQVVDSANLTDAEATTNFVGGLTDEATTFVAGEPRDGANVTNGITLPADAFTEVEFALQATLNAGGGAGYCFRLAPAESPIVLQDREGAGGQPPAGAPPPPARPGPRTGSPLAPAPPRWRRAARGPRWACG